MIRMLNGCMKLGEMADAGLTINSELTMMMQE